MISHSTYKDATPNAWRDDIRNVIDEVGWIRVDVQNEAYNAQYDRQYACRQLQRAQYLSRVGSVRLVNCRLRGICRLTDYDGLRLLLSNVIGWSRVALGLPWRVDGGPWGKDALPLWRVELMSRGHITLVWHVFQTFWGFKRKSERKSRICLSMYHQRLFMLISL